MTRYTVIIVNWNSWDILSQCLDKLKNQTFQNFNVLVIDNASDHPVPKGLLGRYPNVKFVQNKFNVGFAAANNQAIELLTDSEWIGLLNPDAFPEPEWLEHLITAAGDNPSYSMFASRQLIDSSPNVLDGDGDVYHISGLVWREGHGRCQDKVPCEVREIFSPCAAAALYRREALISVGGFDEDYFCYVEDTDIGFRMRLMGHRCLVIPTAVVHHIGGATSGGQQSDFAIYHGHRNLVWTYVKNMPGWLFWACLPLHIGLNLVSAFVYIWRGKGRVILRAKLDALRGLRKIWHMRQEIQLRKVASIGDIWRVLDKRLIPLRRNR